MKGVTMPVTQRTTLVHLLNQDPGLLERGLVRIDEELEIGGARLDLFCVDPARRPVLIYLVGGPLEEQDVPLRVLDGDSAFRRYVPVLRRFFRKACVDWETPPRALVVAEEFSRKTLERFEAIAALEVDLLEIRSLKIRGEQRWAAVPVGGEAARTQLLPADPLPANLEDPLARGLWDSVLDRILKLETGLEVVADRFHREVLCGDHTLATLESGGDTFRVLVPHTNGSLDSERPPRVLRVDGEVEADFAVDLVIRRFLAIRAWEGTIPPVDEGFPAEGDAPDEAPDSSLSGLELAVQSSRLTEDELAAFLDDPEGRGGPGS